MLEANMFYFKREKHFISGNIFKHKIARSCGDCYFHKSICHENPCYVIDQHKFTVLWKLKKLKKH